MGRRRVNVSTGGDLQAGTPLTVSESSAGVFLFGVTSGGDVDQIHNAGGSWDAGELISAGSDKYAGDAALGVDQYGVDSNGDAEFRIFGVSTSGGVKFDYYISGGGYGSVTLGGSPPFASTAGVTLYSDPSGVYQIFAPTAAGDIGLLEYNNSYWTQTTLGTSQAPPPPAPNFTAPAQVAQTGDLNEQDLFVVGADGLVREDRYGYATHSDSGLAVIDANTTFDPAAKLTAFTLGSSVNVFAVGQNGQALWAQYTAAGGWTGFVSLDSVTGNPGVTFPAGTALAGVVQGGSLDLFAVGTDGHVKQYVYDGGAWTFASLDSLPSFPAGAPLAVRGDGSTIDIFGVLADGSVEHLHDAPEIDAYSYAYDALGRVNTFGSVDGTATYGYDPTSQLTSATYTAAAGHTEPADFSANYDPNGNRTAADGASTTVGADNHLTNDGTFTFGYDGEGNLATRTRISSDPASDYRTKYTWDYRNRLTDVEFYNNSGVLTQHVHYVYDVDDHLIERDLDPNGSGPHTQVVHYVWDGPRLASEDRNGTRKGLLQSGLPPVRMTPLKVRSGSPAHPRPGTNEVDAAGGMPTVIRRRFSDRRWWQLFFHLTLRVASMWLSNFFQGPTSNARHSSPRRSAKRRRLLAEGLERRVLLTVNPNAIPTVGVYDENVVQPNTVDKVATGSSVSNVQFGSDVAAAYQSDMGGVINGDVLGALHSYGADHQKVLEVLPGDGTNWGIGAPFNDPTPISGHGAFATTSQGNYQYLLLNFVNIDGGAPNEHVVEFGVTALSVSFRDYGNVTVTGLLNSGGTMSAVRRIDDSAGQGDTFYGLKAPAGDYFTGFSLRYDGAVTPDDRLWFDDIGFVTAQVNQVTTPAATNLVLSADASSSVYGQKVTFNAAVSSQAAGAPTGSVEFVDGATVLDTETLNSNGRASFSTTKLDAGTHSISAIYSGDGNFLASSDATTQAVTPAPLTVTPDSQTKIYGQALAALTGTIDGIQNGDPISATYAISDAAAVPDVGTYMINAAVSDGGTGKLANYDVTLNAGTLTVNPESTSLSVTSSTGGTSTVGQSVTFTAVVSPQAPGAVTPIGSVEFFDGNTELGAQPLVGGQAALSTAQLAAGPHTIRAVYVAGNDDFTPSSGSLTQAVQFVFNGFSPPVGSHTTFNAGQTIAIKFSLSDYNGNAITDLSSVASITIQPTDASGAPTGSAFAPATNGHGLTSAGNHFSLDWHTKGLAAGSYNIVVTLADGTSQIQRIVLR